jgi:hypothetical protein
MEALNFIIISHLPNNHRKVNCYWECQDIREHPISGQQFLSTKQDALQEQELDSSSSSQNPKLIESSQHLSTNPSSVHDLGAIKIFLIIAKFNNNKYYTALTCWAYVDNVTATVFIHMALRTAVARICTCGTVCSHAIFIRWTALRSVANASTCP